LLGVLHTNTALYSAFEWCEMDLFDRLKKEQDEARKICGTHSAQTYFAQITLAVAYMHSKNICHRDLSLENILVDSRNNAKVCDFGASCQYSGLISDRRLIGKPKYRAPEITAKKAYDPKAADAFSLGVILFALLVGAVPFESTDARCGKFQKVVVEGNLDDLLKFWQLEHPLPSDARDVLYHLLAPASRRKTVEEVIAMPYVQAVTSFMNKYPPFTVIPPAVTTSTPTSVVANVSSSSSANTTTLTSKGVASSNGLEEPSAVTKQQIADIQSVFCNPTATATPPAATPPPASPPAATPPAATPPAACSSATTSSSSNNPVSPCR